MQNITITDDITGATFTGDRVDGAAWIRNQFPGAPTDAAREVAEFADLVEDSAEGPDDGVGVGITVEIADGPDDEKYWARVVEFVESGF
jgi:hypothetical protein